jgi:hypothetical protein
MPVNQDNVLSDELHKRKVLIQQLRQLRKAFEYGTFEWEAGNLLSVPATPNTGTAPATSLELPRQ